MKTIKLLKIETKTTRELLFLGWVDEKEVNKQIEYYSHHYNVSYEILDTQKENDDNHS